MFVRFKYGIWTIQELASFTSVSIEDLSFIYAIQTVMLAKISSAIFAVCIPPDLHCSQIIPDEIFVNIQFALHINDKSSLNICRFSLVCSNRTNIRNGKHNQTNICQTADSKHQACLLYIPDISVVVSKRGRWSFVCILVWPINWSFVIDNSVE